MIKNKKSWLMIIGIVLVVGIAVYYPCLFNGKDFFWYNDQQFQYHIFYQEWNNIIQEIKNSHTLAVYSWNTFLGTDFFVSKLFTCVGDFVATPYFILHNGEVNYSALLCIETIICLVISVITMKLYLEKFGIKSEYIINILSIIYGFSGFAMVFSGSYMFHRFYCLLPLLFYFCEQYMQNRKLFGFSLATSLLFLQNYELMFPTSLFLVLYFIFSEKIKNNEKIGILLKKAFPLIISYLIGIAVVGFALIPLLLFIKDGSRIGTMSFNGTFWNFKEIMYFISNYFYSPSAIRSNEPLFLFYSSRYVASEYSFFISPLIIVALLNIKQLPNNDKKIFIIIEIILNACLLIRPLNMVVHGFSEPTFRWSYLLLFFNCLTCAYIFDKCELKIDIIKVILIPVIVLILFFISIYIDDKLDSEHSISIIIYCASVLLIIIFCFLQEKYKKYLLLFAAIECIFCYIYTIKSAWNLYDGNSYEKFNREYLEYYKDIDEDEMYRIYFDASEIPPFSQLCLNDSVEYNYLSTTTYDSAYSWVLNDFLNMNGYNNWIIDINKPELLKMLGAKYIGVLNNTSVIDKLDTEFAYNLDNLKMYKIKDFNHIGHTYSSFIRESQDASNIDWNNELIVPDEIYDELNQYNKISKTQLEVFEYNRQYLKGFLNVPSKTVLFVSIPYSKGWNVKNQNEDKLTTINVQGGFLGVLVDENSTELNFYYGIPGLKFGLVISTGGILCLVGLIFYDKKQRNTMPNNNTLNV